MWAQSTTVESRPNNVHYTSVEEGSRHGTNSREFGLGLAGAASYVYIFNPGHQVAFAIGLAAPIPVHPSVHRYHADPPCGYQVLFWTTIADGVAIFHHKAFEDSPISRLVNKHEY